MNQLPYELDFCHKFNIHKMLGLIMDDYDLKTIARIYGVKLRALKKIEKSFEDNIASCVKELRTKLPQKKPLEKPVRILAIGDSLTSDRESYMKMLKKLWKDDKSRDIVDCSVSGDTTYDLINRFYASILSEEYDWVTLLIGVNDAREPDDGSRVSNLSVGEYERNMKYLVESLLKRDKKLVLITLFQPDSTRLKQEFPENNWWYDKKRIEDANAVIRTLANEHGIPVAELGKKLAEADEDYLEPDGLHMNLSAHMALCELLWDILP